MSDDGIPVETLRRNLEAAKSMLTKTEEDMGDLRRELASVRSELQHRMRNTLATIRSIARRSAERSATVQEYQLHLDGRLAAIGRVQAALLRDPAAGIDLENLIADELASGGRQREERWVVDGVSTRLKPRAAEVLGLAIHELVINAVKFGALSRPEGRIAIGWSFEDAGDRRNLLFSWIESGMDNLPPQSLIQGFGSDVLEGAIAYELDGATSMKFEKSGLHCQIRLPIDCLLFNADSQWKP